MNHNAHCLFAGRLPRAADGRPATPQQRGAPRVLPGSWLTAVTMIGAVLATAALVAGCVGTSSL